ncbi:cytoplasmic protein [Bacillus sp. C1]
MEKHFEEAHRSYSRNRNYLEKDTMCDCFYCLEIFNPSKINDWWDDDTAVCPYCGTDSIIGEGAGFTLTKIFLTEMHQRWFE